MDRTSIRVPFTRPEWNIVVKMYSSNDINDLKQAIAVISSWRAKSSSQLHVAAEMTEMLLRAIISDKERNEDDWYAVGNVSLLYAVAIIRFVNYVNEICKSDDVESVASAVHKMGIPQWVVTVRHDATHGHLPSLQILRDAASFCKTWLWENHWSKTIDEAMLGGKHFIHSEDLVESATKLIYNFILHGFKKNEGSVYHGNDKHIAALKTFILSHPRDFLDALLRDGYFIMTKLQFSRANFDIHDGKKIWNLPVDLQKFWEPVLFILHEARALPELLLKLIVELNASEISFIKERQVLAWIDSMLSSFCKGDIMSQAEWKKILKEMLKVAQKFDPKLFDMLIGKLEDFTVEQKNDLRKLIKLGIKIGSSMDSEESIRKKTSNGSLEIWTEKIYDLQDLMSNCADYNKVIDEPASSKNTWITCEPSEWQNVPLGLTPEQTAESLCLIVDPVTFTSLNCDL